MNTPKHIVGERLLISNRWSQTNLEEVLVMEVAESGHYIKFRDLMSGREFWQDSNDHFVIEKLPPLPKDEGEPVKPYRSPTVADCDRFYKTVTCHAANA